MHKIERKILRWHERNFKEKLGPLVRIKHEPVKLKIDESRGIRPVKTPELMTYRYIYEMQQRKNSTR